MTPRRLGDGADRFLHNAWDDAAPGREALEAMAAKAARDGSLGGAQGAVDSGPWDAFYRRHGTGFFKDRAWVRRDHPWLFAPGLRVLEVGCGAGSALAQFDAGSAVAGCDFSAEAVALAQRRFPGFRFWRADAVRDALAPCDAALLIFALSAVAPGDHGRVLANVHRALSAGGRLVFRDFGRLDHRQVRRPAEQAVGADFYRRGDGTFAFFFTAEGVRRAAEAAGFRVLELAESRSLTVNRRTRAELYRVVVKGVFERLPGPPPG